MASDEQKSLIRRFFMSRLFLISASILTGLLILGYGRAFYQDYMLKQNIADLKEQVNNLQKKKLESLGILDYVMSKQFVEEKARSELNMKKDGEHVVATEEVKKEQAVLSVSNDTGQLVSNPLKWVYYFISN